MAASTAPSERSMGRPAAASHWNKFYRRAEPAGLPGRAAAAGPMATAPTSPLIIGTGYGGSVAALRLAQAGVPVHMVEMGMAWDTPGPDGKIFANTRTPDYRSYWLRTRTKQPIVNFLGFPLDKDVPRYTGILDAEDFGEILVYQGRGVGGGSLVNGGMAVTPKRARFSSVLPSVNAAEMSTSTTQRQRRARRQRDRRVLVRQHPAYQYSRVGRKHAQRSNFDFLYVPNVYDFDSHGAGGGWNGPEVGARRRDPLRQQPRQVVFATDIPGTMCQGHRSRHDLGAAQGDVGVARVRRRVHGRHRAARHDRRRHGLPRPSPPTACSSRRAASAPRLLVRDAATGKLPNRAARSARAGATTATSCAAAPTTCGTRTGALQSSIPTAGIDNWDDGGAFEVAPIPTGIETWAVLPVDHRHAAPRGVHLNAAAGRAN